jgi:four helix bundle protein
VTSHDVKSDVNKVVKKDVKYDVRSAWNSWEGSYCGTDSCGHHAQFLRMAQFRVLDAARAVADETNKLLATRRLRLIHRRQLRDAAQSIPANVREGMGRTPGSHRNQAYRHARGSAEETDEHLRANFADGRLPPSEFWRLHNRIAVVVKMLTSIVDP